MISSYNHVALKLYMELILWFYGEWQNPKINIRKLDWNLLYNDITLSMKMGFHKIKIRQLSIQIL